MHTLARRLPLQFEGSSKSFLVSTERIPELCRVFSLQRQFQEDAVKPGPKGSATVATAAGATTTPAIPTPYTVLGSFTGQQLLGVAFRHPTHDRRSPILVGKHVTNDSGTGLVHTAPGHGMEDFDVVKAHPELSLPVLCPVDDAGKFTSDAGSDLAGLSVLSDGNIASLKASATARCAPCVCRCIPTLFALPCTTEAVCQWSRAAHRVLFASLPVRLAHQAAGVHPGHEAVVCQCGTSVARRTRCTVSSEDVPSSQSTPPGRDAWKP